MICRSLVKDKATGKQNIVWFGSCGKNIGYMPIEFAGYDDDGNPVVSVNGSSRKWQNCYLDFYIATRGPFKNESLVWGETFAYPRDDLYPADDLYPDPGTEVRYFRLDTEIGSYIPVETMPSDWNDHYMDYYIAEFEPNQDPQYDPSRVYYAHGNKISGENYSHSSEGVRSSLIQRLSVLKGELWYKASYGLPLTEKVKNKGIYDSIIINIITTHPDVKNLISYSSSFDKKERKYAFEFKALTVYGNELSVSYAI